MTPESVRLAVLDLRGHRLPRGRLRQQGLPYKVAFLLKACLIADLLRGDSSFKQMLELAICTVLPPVIQRPFVSFLKEGVQRIPHKGTLSRWRFVLDGAHMVWMRRRNDAEGPGRFARSFMADSSMQRGREFEVILILEVKQSLLAQVLKAAVDLSSLWSSGEVDEEGLQAEQELLSFLKASLQLWHLPLMVLGSGRTKLSDKFRATLFAIFWLPVVAWKVWWSFCLRSSLEQPTWV